MKYIVASILLLSQSPVFAGYEKAREQYVKGLSYALSGEYDNARKSFDYVDKYQSYWSELGRILLNDIRSETIDKQTASHLVKAIEYFLLKNKIKAAAECDKAINSSPNYAFAYYMRGRFSKYRISDFDKAIELSPGLVIAYRTRAWGYWRIKKKKLALRDYEKAIELDMNRASSYHYRANFYQWADEHKLAIEDYTRSISLNSSASTSYERRGTSYLTIGQTRRGLEDYEKAIALSPESASVYRSRSDAFKQLGMVDKQCEDLKKAYELRAVFGTDYREICGKISVAKEKPAQKKIGRQKKTVADAKKKLMQERCSDKSLVRQIPDWLVISKRGGQVVGHIIARAKSELWGYTIINDEMMMVNKGANNKIIYHAGKGIIISPNGDKVLVGYDCR